MGNSCTSTDKEAPAGNAKPKVPPKKGDAAAKAAPGPPQKATKDLLTPGRVAALVILGVFGAIGGVVVSKQQENPQIAALTAAGTVMYFLLILAVTYVVRNWDLWFEQAIKDAFEQVDIDKSNSIDKAELYAGVLLMYVNINVYVKVYAPERDDIMKIMERIDADKSGHLDYAEFREIMLVLSGQILARAVTQILFTVACPLCAGYIVDGTVAGIVLALPAAAWEKIPASAKELYASLPEGLASTVVGSVLLMLMPVAFKMIDDHSKNKAQKARQEVKNAN